MGSKRSNTPQAPSPVRIGLPPDCRMAAQSALLVELLGALDAPEIGIDGSTVERVDTAALQLLTLFRREALVRGRVVNWLGASETLYEAAGVLGLAKILDLPAPVPVC